MYKNYQKRGNSTLQPLSTDAHTDFTCTVKGPCSIIDPVLDIYLSGTTPADNPAGLGYNYAYIPTWNRYYFINNWTYNNGIWRAYLHVDVLASYKTEIGALSKYVLRSASNYDTGIMDNCLTKLPPDKTITPYTIAGVLKSPFTASNSTTGTDGSFIIGIQGPQPNAAVPAIGGVCYYLLTFSEMVEFLNYLTSHDFTQLMKDDAAGLTEEVVKVLQDPSQYIVNCMWYPFTITRVNSPTGIQPKIGFWNTSPITSGTTALGSKGLLSLSETVTLGSGIAIPSHPQEAGGEYGLYLRAAPYSLYTFHFEPWGDIQLDGSMLTDAESITGTIHIDLVSGAAALDLFAYKSTGNVYTPLGRYFAQVGVNVGIAQLIYEMQPLSGALLSAAAGAASTVNNWASEQGKIAGEALIAGADPETVGLQTLSSFVTKNETGTSPAGQAIQNAVAAGLAYMASPHQSGVNGSYLSYIGSYGTDPHGTAFMTNGPYLETIHYTVADANNAEIGRPLRQVVQLNTLSGFIKCADGEHNIAATTSEKSVISAYLTGGFFYE